MGDEVTATLYTKYGDTELVGETVTYSAAQYCYDMLDNIKDDDSENAKALKTLLVDLLNYGAADQVYSNYNTDALVNAGLTDEQKAYASTEVDPYENHLEIKGNDADDDATWKSGGLTLGDEIALRMSFILKEGVSIDGVYVVITTDDNKTGWRIDELEAVPGTTNRYYVRFNGLNPHQIRDKVYLAIYDAEGNLISGELTYSIISYAYANGAKEKLVNIIDTMVKYCDAVKAYRETI